jgi:hypothetical protein
MSKFKQLLNAKLRMAHYKGSNLFDDDLTPRGVYTDNRSNTRANTCIKRPTREGRAVLVRFFQNQCMPFGVCFVVDHNNCSERTALCWRQVIRTSHLSAFDGSVVDYHGFDG